MAILETMIESPTKMTLCSHASWDIVDLKIIPEHAKFFIIFRVFFDGFSEIISGDKN